MCVTCNTLVISYTFRARGMVEYGQYECAIDGVWSGGRR